MDLYAPCHSSAQHLPQKLVDSTLLEDIVKMRNDIAHGSPIRPEWTAQRVRRGTDDISYADELTDAVTAVMTAEAFPLSRRDRQFRISARRDSFPVGNSNLISVPTF